MSVVQTAEPIILSFTDNAADKVHSLISEEGNDNLNLRVFVTGGGWSGFQYGFSFEEAFESVYGISWDEAIPVLAEAVSKYSYWFYFFLKAQVVEKERQDYWE